jgi:L-malate glycosyltransferase
LSSPKKINVLVIPDLFPKFPGDLQGIFVLDYLRSTASYCNNTVLFLKINGITKGLTIEQTEDATIHRYNLSADKVPFFLKPFYYLQLFSKGYKIGKQFEDIDIIHSHGTIVSGTLSYFLARKLKVPFVITEHQGPFSMISGSFWKRNWARFIMQKANILLTVSDHLKQEILASHIHPKEINVTYNPVDTELFSLKDNTLKKKILFAGRLDNFKGAFRCVEAFHQISNLYPDWVFTIVGDGEDFNPIKNYLERNIELQQKISLLGSKSKTEIAKEMQNADFFVFPSKHESFGLVVAEALSCGLPVITTNQTAPKEFVNQTNGLLVYPYNITEIAEAMRAMINNLSIYNSQAIRQTMVDNYSFENFGKKLSNIYKSLLN